MTRVEEKREGSPASVCEDGYPTLSARRRRILRAGAWLALIAPSVAGVFLLPPGLALWSALLLGLSVTIAHRWMNAPGAVAVLKYHNVSESPESWLPWWRTQSVAPASFRRHLQILRRTGCNVISTRELLDARQAGRDLPPRSVVIHFDDGYLDNWVAAVPMLQEFGMPATIFVSLDFIEPGETVRPTLADVSQGSAAAPDLAWAGYLNVAELRALDQGALIQIESHGVDHARAEIGPRIVDRIGPDNWKEYAWVQWAAMPGSKVGWYKSETPPAVPFGAPIRENASALCRRSWSEGGVESASAFEERVRQNLRRARTGLETLLARPVEVLCWPYNECSTLSRRLAEEVGFRATTGGRGENRPCEDARVISRVHAGDAALGFRVPWVDDVAFVAAVRLAQGCYYWALVVLPLAQLRKVVLGLRRAIGSSRRRDGSPRRRPSDRG